MPYIKIELAGPISKEQKQEIAKRVTQVMQEVAAKPPQYTYVVFNEVELENWAIAGQLLSED